jgi:hypothetical protein
MGRKSSKPFEQIRQLEPGSSGLSERYSYIGMGGARSMTVRGTSLFLTTHVILYQEDFVTPGMRPWEAI